MRTVDQRIASVMRLVLVARELLCDDELADALALSTGLSREGVELALTEHLEVSPSHAEVKRLVLAAGTADVVHVVLASNVFTAALRAIAVARAAAPHVRVASSSREPVFARALVERASDPGLSVVESFDAESLADDGHVRSEVHVYGRDETIAEIRSHAPPHVRVRGHGTGLGLACVAGDDLDSAASAVARDVVPFDQRGCLSPRVVLFVGSDARAEAFCALLDRSLESMEQHVPRGVLDSEESAAVARYLVTMDYAGRVWRGSAHLVGLAARGAPLWVPPAGRHVHVAVVAHVAEARALISKVQHFITAVGTDSMSIGKELASHPVRLSALGQMQKPPFDGPVDLRG
jgi:hypothetical protein